MKKKSMSSSNIGTVSLLMIFIVLCLVTFATLSLSNTVSEFHYSQKLAKQNEDYFTASNEAVEILAEHDLYISSQLLSGGGQLTEEAYLDALAQYFEADGRNMEFDRETSGLSYDIAINEGQNLHVAVTFFPYPQAVEGQHYVIREWKKVPSRQWSADESMQLLQ